MHYRGGNCWNYKCRHVIDLGINFSGIFTSHNLFICMQKCANDNPNSHQKSIDSLIFELTIEIRYRTRLVQKKEEEKRYRTRLEFVPKT